MASPPSPPATSGVCSQGSAELGAGHAALLWAKSPRSAGCVTNVTATVPSMSRPRHAGLLKQPAQGARPSVRLSAAPLAPRSPAAVAVAGVSTILSLAALLPAAAFPCAAPRLDNATASKLLGTWLYVAGAAQFPQHILEMLLIDHGHLHVKPQASEQELLITQHVAVGDQCLTNNSTYFEIAAGNTTLVKHAKTQQTMGTLMNISSEDVLLIQYELQRERMYRGLYLYARNLSLSTAEREEFEQQAKCLGLSQEEIVYAPWKTDTCGKWHQQQLCNQTSSSCEQGQL